MPHDLKKRLTINNITCTNEDGLYVLENVSFEAFGGEVLGLPVFPVVDKEKRIIRGHCRVLQSFSSGSVIFHSPEGEDIDLAKI